MNISIPRPCPEMLWREGAHLTAAELSSLLEDCTGHTVESITDEDGEPAFYVIDPAGDRLDDGFPFPCLDSLCDLVGWRIDEALTES